MRGRAYCAARFAPPLSEGGAHGAVDAASAIVEIYRFTKRAKRREG
jgi:hypothetical protein